MLIAVELHQERSQYVRSQRPRWQKAKTAAYCLAFHVAREGMLKSGWRRAYRIEPSADVHLGVGFTAEVPGGSCIRRFRIPAVNCELRVPTLNNEPVDGMAVYNSADFTSVFPHRCHQSLSLLPIATV